jgi:16S rRNA processing protein RimM
MDLLAIGIVKAPHGVKGEVMVHSFSGSVEKWDRLREASFRKANIRRVLRIVSLRPVPGGALMKVEGFDTPEEAREIAGSELWVDREYASPLEAGEFHTADLCRCSVFFGEERIGAVRSICDAGSSQLLEIRAADGRIFLVPFIDHFIGEVDVEAGRISLREDYIIR